MCPPGRVSTYSDVQGPANQQTSFSGRGDECVAHKLPFSGHIIKKFQGPSILQLNIEGLTASKMNVLHHLATQLEAFVILLQETHCTSAEKLVLSNYQLAGFSLSRKHGLATFVHERLKWTLYDQSPTTSETEWLCVDVDRYKIVNIYKPPPTRLQVSDLPVFTHPCLYAGDFNCPHVDWGYNTNSADGDCLLAWASSNNLALLHDSKDEPSFHSGRWNTGTNPDLAFTTVGRDSRLPYRRVLEKFPRSQHRPSLITPPRLSLPVPGRPVKRWNFRKANWSHYNSLTNRDQSSRAATALITWLDKKRRDRWSEAVRNIYFSHSSRKAWSTINNLTGMSRHSPCNCPVSANAIAAQLVRNGKYEGVDRKSSGLISQEVSDRWRTLIQSPVNFSGDFSSREFAAALQHV